MRPWIERTNPLARAIFLGSAGRLEGHSAEVAARVIVKHHRNMRDACIRIAANKPGADLERLAAIWSLAPATIRKIARRPVPEGRRGGAAKTARLGAV